MRFRYDLSEISFTTRMIELRLQLTQRHTKSIRGFASDWNSANSPMRTKHPAALLKRKSVSHSFDKRDFLVVRRESARFLLSGFFLLIACSAFAQSSSQPGAAKFDGQSWW